MMEELQVPVTMRHHVVTGSVPQFRSQTVSNQKTCNLTSVNPTVCLSWLQTSEPNRGRICLLLWNITNRFKCESTRGVLLSVTMNKMKYMNIYAWSEKPKVNFFFFFFVFDQHLLHAKLKGKKILRVWEREGKKKGWGPRWRTAGISTNEGQCLLLKNAGSCREGTG